MKIALLSFLFLTSCAITPKSEPKGDMSTSPASSDQVPIIYKIDKEMFPASWRNRETTAKSLNESEIARSEKVIQFAIQKYPSELIKKNLEKVYVVGELKLFGVDSNGTNSLKRIYIKNSGTSTEDLAIENQFHAEFSNILLRNFVQNFDEQKWQAANEPRFKYLDAGIDSVKKISTSEEFTPYENMQGVLNQHSRLNWETDFTAYAKYLWTGNKKLWKLADKYKRVGRKLDLMIEFYHSIDSKLDKKYFKNLLTP